MKTLQTVAWIILVIHAVALYMILLHRREIPQMPVGSNSEINIEVPLTGLIAPIKLGTNEKTKSVGAYVVQQVLDNQKYNIKAINEFVKRDAPATDPGLIALARSMMDPPYTNGPFRFSHGFQTTPQSKAVDELLKQQKKGFFIEVGAQDGERASNTAFFEYKRGWTGLIMEVDPMFYIQLRGKNRRSYSINACLSPSGKPSVLRFEETGAGNGKIIDGNAKYVREVPCFPLETLLMALNQTRVDFFSLDIEGYELDVLKTFPLDKYDIRTFAIEYRHIKEGKDGLMKYMEPFGYKVYKDIHHDEPIRVLYVWDVIVAKSTMLK